MELTWYSWLLSFLPILTVVILMIVFKWSGTRAAAASWLVATGLAVAFFGADIQVLSVAQVKAFLLAMDVLWIVWGAISFYHLANEGGTIKLIGDLVPLWMKDRSLQVLMVTLVLTSFMQGMGGFGVPVAICAPILVAMGFSAVDAVVMACLGHAWAVSFGTIGAAFNAMVAVTGLPSELLAPDTAVLLGAAIFPCAALILWIAQGKKGLLNGLPAVLVLSLGMGIAMYLMAANKMSNIAIFGATIVGAALLFLIRRLPRYREGKAFSADSQEASPRERFSPKRVRIALVPYILLVSLGVLIALVPPLKATLETLRFSLNFPEVSTAFNWVTPAGGSKVFYPLEHAGTLTMLVVLIGGFVYAQNGLLHRDSPAKILNRSLRTSLEPSLGILAMVAVSQIMTHSGMTSLLARGLGESINRYLYPATVPFLGMLGAFLTGSNNNSNVLFAPLQLEAATILKLSIPLILAAQTAGGAIGSVMTPAKVIVGCSTIGLEGKEGLVLKKLLIYDLVVVFYVAVLATVLSALR